MEEPTIRRRSIQETISPHWNRFTRNLTDTVGDIQKKNSNGHAFGKACFVMIHIELMVKRLFLNLTVKKFKVLNYKTV